MGHCDPNRGSCGVSKGGKEEGMAEEWSEAKGQDVRTITRRRLRRQTKSDVSTWATWSPDVIFCRGAREASVVVEWEGERERVLCSLSKLGSKPGVAPCPTNPTWTWVSIGQSLRTLFSSENVAVAVLSLQNLAANNESVGRMAAVGNMAAGVCVGFVARILD